MIVILAGMPDEKRILTNALPGVLVLSGPDKLNLSRLVPPGCTRLLCMGVAGGLAPDLKVPDVAVATSVTDHAGQVANADILWNVLAAKAVFDSSGIALHPVPWYSSGLMDEADAAPQRAAMFKKYGAHVIDDETRWVVAEATARQIPFNVIRPLSDDWSETLPLAATGATLNKDGSSNFNHLFWALAQRSAPGAVDLMRVASDYSKALDALEAVAKALASLIAS